MPPKPQPRLWIVAAPLATLAAALAALATSACVARSEPPTAPPEDPLAWLAHFPPVLEPLAPPTPTESEPIATYATLADLLRVDGWAGCQACSGDICACLTTRATLTVPAPQPNAPPPDVREVRLVGHQSPDRCAWMLLIKARDGWLAPYPLGTSPADCRTTLDATSPDQLDVWWYPLAVSQTPADPSTPFAFRLEGEGADTRTLFSATPEVPAARTIDRIVWLCRVDGHALACAMQSTPARTVVARLDAPLAAALTTPLDPDPTLAPLSAAARVGTTWNADWIVTPSADPLTQERRFGTNRVQTVPFRPGQTLAIAAGERFVRVQLQADHQVYDLALIGAERPNEALELTGVVTTPGLVRVQLARAIKAEGVTGALDVLWQWEELFVAAPPARHVRILTGIALADARGPLASWRRDLVADAQGLDLREHDGALAWFRGTGHFTWEAFAARLPAWRRAMGQAFQAAPRDRRRRHAGAPESEAGLDDFVAQLELLPGFIEPLAEIFADEVAPLAILPDR